MNNTFGLKWKNQVLKGESSSFSLPHQIEHGFCTKNTASIDIEGIRNTGSNRSVQCSLAIAERVSIVQRKQTGDWRKLFMTGVTVAVSLGILLYPKTETTLGIYGIANV